MIRLLLALVIVGLLSYQMLKKNNTLSTGDATSNAQEIIEDAEQRVNDAMQQAVDKLNDIDQPEAP